MDEVENILVEGLMVIIQLNCIRTWKRSLVGNYDTIQSVFGNQLEVFQKDGDRYGARIVAHRVRVSAQ